jgi:hypothetical protein
MRKHFQEVLAPGAAADDGDIRAFTRLTSCLPGFGRGGVFFRSGLGGLSGLALTTAHFGHGGRLLKM